VITFAFLLALAQLAPPNAAGVSMGHYHLNVSDLEKEKDFWVGVFGAEPMKHGTLEGVRLPGTLIVFKSAKPSAGTEGSIVKHIGLKVKDLSTYTAKLQAKGFSFNETSKGKQAMVTGPDGLMVELTADAALPTPVANHHIHFYTTEVKPMQAWYAAQFGAIPGKRAIFDAADLPGVNLTFSASDVKLDPTRGRALDHIGFEIKDLKALCAKLEAAGVKFDVPYRQVPALGISIAFFTDPWGTYVELTEGLDKI
jgi:catechol 2,3-dioxygenase-like lactoylglutathione lyase family enzyme